MTRATQYKSPGSHSAVRDFRRACSPVHEANQWLDPQRFETDERGNVTIRLVALSGQKSVRAARGCKEQGGRNRADIASARIAYWRTLLVTQGKSFDQ